MEYPVLGTIASSYAYYSELVPKTAALLVS
jgi:hypothetical protein